MKTHFVRMQLVSLTVLALAGGGGPVGAQEHQPLSFAMGATFQDATLATNISALGVVAGLGFEWPVGHTLALRADAAYSYFGKALFSETILDCVASPCVQPPNHFATFNTAFDVVFRPSAHRLHYIVGVSREHVAESMMSGPRAANALDMGVEFQLGPHAAIETEIQWLETAVGPTRWMVPIRVRWR